VAVTLIILAVSWRDAGALKAAEYALLGNLGWLIIWGIIHLVRTPWLIQREGIPRDSVRQAAVLAMLPVYRNDLSVELIGARRGVSLAYSEGEYIFLELRIVATVAKSVLPPIGIVKTATEVYKCDSPASIAEWTREEILETPTWPYQNNRDTQMSTLALWGIGAENLSPGIHKQGWIAILTGMRPQIIKLEDIESIILRIEDGSGYVYKFSFPKPIAESPHKIFHKSVMRRLR
jgi:hypothetical protein